MKKLISVLLVMLLLLSMAACSTPSEGKNPSGGTQDGQTPTGDGATEPSQQPLRMKYFCKNLGDLSFNDLGWAGCQTAAQKYGWIAEVVECGSDTATFENAFLDTCESGDYDIVVTQAGFGMSDLCIKYAGDYPNMTFICFDMTKGTDISSIDNMFGISFKQNEGAFLAGALAGKLTASDQLGVFLMGDVPSNNDYATGYLSGVRYANETATVAIAYGGGVADASKLQEISSAMFDRGIDVIFGVSSSCFPGLAREAVSRGGFAEGLYTIGVDSDMWTTFNASENPQYAEVIIASAMKRADIAVEYACDRLAAGTLEFGVVQPLGVAEGATALADNEYYRAQVPEELLSYIDDLSEQILAGTLVVQSYYDFESYDAYAAWRNSMSTIDENSIS